MEPFRVIIIDDDHDFAESLSIAVEDSGYEVELAYDGEEAIKKFQENNFDVAFMDVKLPGKNGVESYMEIKKFKPGANVIMMTGYSVEKLLKQAKENGVLGILNKPVNIPEFLNIIKKVENKGILIVDDDPDFLSSIKECLSNSGYRVFLAQNGTEAIELSKTRDIDILILDIRMPFMNGLETYLEIKKANRHTSTIIVTAFADEENDSINEFHSMAINNVLRKPFNPEDLLVTINSLADNRHR